MANQLFGLVVAILAAVLFGSAGATQSQKDQWGCDEVDGVCITSFKWCTSSSKDASAGCSLPGGTHSLYYNGEEATSNALVMWDGTYSLTWKNADPAYPVKVEWRSGDEDEAFTWSREFASDETKFEFTFERLAKDMLENYDIRLSEIKDEVSTFHSRFLVSQPRGSGRTKDVSDQFVVFDNTAIPYSHMQTLSTRDETFVKWGLGVGVAIGIGLLVLLVLVFFLGWHVGKRVTKKRAAETGVEGGLSNGTPRPSEQHTVPVTEKSTDTKDTGELSERKANAHYQ